MTGADLLTALRGVTAVPVVLLLLVRRRPATVAAGVLFCAGGVSDLLDGYLARRASRTSHLGTWLDPLADKILVDGATLALALSGQLPPRIAYGLIARDLLITCLRTPRLQQRTLTPGWLAKAKTALLYVGIGGLIFTAEPDASEPRPLERVPTDAQATATSGGNSPPKRLMHQLRRAARWCVTAGVILSVFSAIEYAVRLARLFRPGSQSRPALR